MGGRSASLLLALLLSAQTFSIWLLSERQFSANPLRMWSRQWPPIFVGVEVYTLSSCSKVCRRAPLELGRNASMVVA